MTDSGITKVLPGEPQPKPSNADGAISRNCSCLKWSANQKYGMPPLSLCSADTAQTRRVPRSPAS